MRQSPWLVLSLVLAACEQQVLPGTSGGGPGLPFLPGGTSGNTPSVSMQASGGNASSEGDPFAEGPVNRPLSTTPLVACPVAGAPRARAAADFLFMVDTSGSMLEEQTNLALSLSSLCRPDRPCTNPCGLQANLDRVKDFAWGPGCGVAPDAWASLSDEGLLAQTILRDCSFLERLYLRDVDWQAGVITAEMRDYEGLMVSDRIICGGETLAREPRPQRGCLQPEEVTGQRVLSSSHGTHQEHVEWLRSMVLGAGLCGSGLERGLTAVDGFVHRTVEPASAECAMDPDVLLRTSACTAVNEDGTCARTEEPALVIVFLSDEEDCSYTAAVDGGPDSDNRMSALRCYTRPDTLRPTGEFVDSLRQARSNPQNLRMAGIVGGTFSGETFEPGGCRCNTSHRGAAAITECTPAYGNSISQFQCGLQVEDPFCQSAPDPRLVPEGQPQPPLPCCIADMGERYTQVVKSVHKHAMESICSQSYHAVMARTADLVR